MQSQWILGVAILALDLYFPSSSLACEPDLENHCEYYSTDMRKVPAEANEFPWTVFVKITIKSDNATKSDSDRGCGGVVIDRKWILTAAHCVHPAELVLDATIIAGAHNLMFPNSNEQTMDAKSIIVHGNYNHTKASKGNDIALIELNSVLQFNEFVNLIRIRSIDGDIVSRLRGKYVQSGWGSIPCTCNREFPDILMKSSITGLQLRESLIYAVGFVEDGDSGGPLISNPSGPTGHGLIGITSWSYLPNEDIKLVGGPITVFTRVEYFVPWIKVHAYGDSPASFGTTFSKLPAIKFSLNECYADIYDTCEYCH